MNTKKALDILSKGEASPASPLAQHRERFVAAFEQRSAAILERQNTDVVQLPFLDSLRRKVAKMVDSPDNSLPVVGRYDLYTGVRKLAERSTNDNGLTRLVPHLEKLWQADPLGTLNYGEVRGLVASLRDRYPRSKAADAIEAECTRVGLHKLPVAKLARIAGTIYSQQDYDVAMQAHGLGGDRPEQIRARALVRGLVELRNANIELDAREKQARDERNVEQRVADRVQAEWEKPWLKKKDKGEGEESEADEDESAEKEAQLEDGPPKDDKKDKGPPKKDGPPKSGPSKKGPPSAPPGGDDGLDEPADEPGLDLGGPDEMGDEPGMGGSGPEQAQEVMQEIDEAAQEIINDAPPEAMDFIEHEEAEGHHTAPPGTAQWGAEEILLEDHTAPPPSDEWLAEEMEEMNGAGGEMPGMDMGGPPGMPPAGPPMGGPPGMGAPAMPPPGPGLMQSAAPPGAMPMAPPPKPAPMAPPMAPKPEAPGHFNRMRGEKMADKEKNKGGIPLPGKIKTQPEVTTYAKNISKDNGGKVLKASDVEARLLAGQGVKIGSVSISINSSNEVELWNKDAGRACDLMQLDTAIADFMAMCRAQKAAREAQKITFDYRIAELVSVPCEQCGDMSTFEKAANVQDEYGCSCGHLISAGLVNELSELAGWTKTHQLQIRHVAEKDVSKNSVQYRILEALEQIADEGATLDELGPGHILATIRNFDGDAVVKFEQEIQKLGGKIAQMGAPGAPPMGAPGGGAGAGPPGGAGPAVAAGAPLSELIQSAMAHYHNMGMAYLPAVGQLRKDFKERETEFDTPEAGMLVMQVGQQLWSGTGGAPTAGGAGAAGAPGGAPPAAAPPGPGSTTMMAALKIADSKMKAPSIRKPKDHISVPDDLGKDSETSGSIPTPGSIKTQPNKEQHQKMSPKELGKDSEGKDLLPDPGKPKVTHDPKSQSGIKLPEKGLDADHESDDPFKTPSLGAEPKVKKS